MKLKWIATAAFGIVLAPGVVLAQSKTSTTDTTKTSTAQPTTTTTSTGDVSSSSDISKNVTPAMTKAQDDPKLIGSPAWWKTHGTADGKPLSAKSQSSKADTTKKPE